MPIDEAKRLATLKSLDILDTKAEERFDRITRMAKRMFHVPIALISLVDSERQWFKSCIGVSVSETSRDISFCGHTILGDDVLVVNNALDDPRFFDNPLVLEPPYIRFYAGCPLVVNGYKIGTLCIIDPEIRFFDQDDIEALKDLASTVEFELSAVELATMDDLTGIANRRGFLILAQNNLHLSLRTKVPVSLVYMDLDYFKRINDSLGHAEGDSVLINFANLLKAFFRRSDTLGRLGGDEFVITFNNTTKDQAEMNMLRFNLALKKHNQKMNRNYNVSFSYGIVEFNPIKHTSINELLSDADDIMYQLKNAKK